MAFVDWPSPATAGMQYEFEGRYWVFTSTGAWRQLTNGGQVSVIFIKLSDYVEENVIPLSPIIENDWVILNYV